ncbi:uncharacterized protein [Pyrus communis]|uniref:uncharacterized protein n=1 Tax=Pyrus communis TaxID=23211 RepID=UPI0035C26735
MEQGLLARDKLLAMLKTNLQAAQNLMKTQADKHQSERVFKEGDLVYLKLIPYQVQSLAFHAYHKLYRKYYGPYEVLEKIGKVEYWLKLPKDSKIHLVFHVSCLKNHLEDKVIATPFLPIVTDDGLLPLELLKVLKRRVYKKGKAAGVQLLIQWKNNKEDKATWKDYDEFATKFPNFSL